MPLDSTDKRYQIDTTTSINNLRINFNEFLKKLDWVGYKNLLDNSTFQTRFMRDLSAGDSQYALAKWSPDWTTTNLPIGYHVEGASATTLAFANGHATMPDVSEKIYLSSNVNSIRPAGIFVGASARRYGAS